MGEDRNGGLRTLKRMLGTVAVSALLVACGANSGQDQGAGATTSPATQPGDAPLQDQGAGATTSPTTQLGDAPLVAIQAATQGFFESCISGDHVQAQSHVAPELRELDWGQACTALSEHGLSMVENQVAVDGFAATSHVRITGGDGSHEEDWLFRFGTDDAWQMSNVPPLLTGAWDDDGHHWLPVGPAAEITIHPAADGHDHGTATTAGHFDGDEHDHGTATTAGHFDGDGHDHGTATTADHFDGDGHDHGPHTTDGHEDDDG